MADWEHAERAISQTLGIPLEALAMADRNQPGILEAQRKQAGMTILASFAGCTEKTARF